MENNRTNETSVFVDSCMLVSDSNETSTQLDSMRLSYQELVSLAQDTLFKKHLDMSKYLTNSEFEMLKGVLNDEYGVQNDLKPKLPSKKPKLRAVDGQVILIEAESIPSGYTPQGWVQENWLVPTSEFQLVPIPDSMLRGMAAARADGVVAKLPENKVVGLTSENMPAHMHHDAVTTGSGMTTLKGDSASTTYVKKGALQYDLFYNDSMDVGLSKNEMDGAIDRFSVAKVGPEKVYHDNMPKYHAFYGFVVQRLDKQ